MEFFEIFSYYTATEKQSHFAENYIDILSIISTIYLGFVAFVYIKILDTKKEIKESSNFILLEMYKKEHLLNSYLIINSTLLLLSLLFVIIKNFLNDNFIDFIILANLIFAIIDVIYNIHVCLLLEEYMFKKEKILKKRFVINYNVDLNKNENETFNKKLAFIRFEILNEVNSNNINVQYINQMLKEFEKILNSSKDFLNKYYINKQCSSNDLNLNYYYQILYEIQYIFQTVVKNNNRDNLSYYFLDFIVSIFENLMKVAENIKIQNFYFNIITSEIKFMYKMLLKSNTDNINLNILFKIYKLLLAYSYKNFSYLYNLQKPNNLIFDIIKNVIDSNLKNKKDILIFFSKNLDISFVSSSDDVKYRNYLLCNIINLNYSVLAYLYFKNDYFLFKEYLQDYNSNSTIFCRPVFITNMNMIIQYSIDSNFNVFENNEKFNSHITSEEYKIYVLLFFFLKIYLCLQDYIQNIKSLLRNSDGGYINHTREEINRLLNIDYIEQLPNKDIFYSIYTNFDNNRQLNIYIDNFFNNKDFLKLFIFEKEINKSKNFIIKQFKRIEKRIKDKQNKLISSNINSDSLLNTRNEFIKELQEYTNHIKYDKIKIENIKNINKFFNIPFEKYYFISEDYKNQLYNIMREINYYKIYNNIFDKCTKISSIAELKDINLNSYIIINNFSSYAKNFKNIFFENENIRNTEDYTNIENIKIYDTNIPVYNIGDFHVNPDSKTSYSILIIKEDFLKILKIDGNIFDNDITFKEENIDDNDNLEYCFKKDYRSNKKIVIKIPEIVSVKFYDNFVGYKILLKE